MFTGHSDSKSQLQQVVLSGGSEQNLSWIIYHPSQSHPALLFQPKFIRRLLEMFSYKCRTVSCSTVYVCISRLVFSVHDLAVTSPVYNYFRLHLEDLVSDGSMFQVEEVPTDFPVYFNHKRSAHLVSSHILISIHVRLVLVASLLVLSLRFDYHAFLRLNCSILPVELSGRSQNTSDFSDMSNLPGALSNQVTLCSLTFLD